MQISISAKSYYSFFSTDGSAVITLNARKMKNKAALMWIVGDLDIITTSGDGRRIYNTETRNPKSQYIEVNGGYDEVRKMVLIRLLNGLRTSKIAYILYVAHLMVSCKPALIKAMLFRECNIPTVL